MFILKKMKMEEEATQPPQTHFSSPIQAKSVSLGFADHLCLNPALWCIPSLCNHLFPPPLSHHLLQERNQDILIFIIPVLSTAHVHESCPICIYYIETHPWMLVYVSILCNLYFPMTNISIPKSQIYVKYDWILFLSLQSTFFSWELREEREQVSELYFLILKPSVFFFFPSTERSVSDFDTFLSAFSSAFTSVFCNSTSI